MRTLLALLVLTTPAAAQLVLYDAGTAGNPAVPVDPGVQGWQYRTSGASMGVAPIANDGGLNAWEINDPTPAGDPSYGYYYQVPSVPNFLAVLAGAWELTLTTKVTAGPDPALFLEVNNGFFFLDTGYRVFLSISGQDVVVHDGWGTALFVCTGAADGTYHHFTLRKTNTVMYGNAEFLFDGDVLGAVPEDWPGSYAFDIGVKFGTWTDYGQGRARFHRVEFRALDDLGILECVPAQANSTGSPAALEGWGSPYVDQNLVELTASGLPPNQFGYLLASLTPAFNPLPGGSQGNLCLGGVIARFTGQVQSSGAAGTIVVPVDLTIIPANPTTSVAPGETWHFQLWYRDQNPGPTSNFTPARAIEFR